jgi:phosphatidylserine decarboxylase
MNADARSLRDRLFIAAQHLLPQHLLSRLLGVLAGSRFQPLKDWLIRRFIAHFAVDMSEAAEPDPAVYPHFNAFFTRALREGMRPVDAAPHALTSPADGAVSQLGAIEDGRIFQAKGHWFSAAELLADAADARLFENGSFATIYLSPRDYHRVHMPLTGRLRALRYVPGKLFSVNQVTAESVPGLFARNERLVCLFDTEYGPVAMVLVGAMVVAGIETVWTGPVTPAGRHVFNVDYELDVAARTLQKGAEMGRFQLGSTVILLLPRGVASWHEALVAGSPLRMGQRIGSLLI